MHIQFSTIDLNKSNWNKPPPPSAATKNQIKSYENSNTRMHRQRNKNEKNEWRCVTSNHSYTVKTKGNHHFFPFKNIEMLAITFENSMSFFHMMFQIIRLQLTIIDSIWSHIRRIVNEMKLWSYRMRLRFSKWPLIKM